MAQAPPLARRPSRRAPGRARAAFWAGAAALVTVLGLAFPLAGAAIVAVLILDATLLRAKPAARRVLS